MSEPSVSIEEQWRDVIGFEGFYRVSNTGRVASQPIPKGLGMRARKGRELSLWGKRQPSVDFMVHGERTRFLVARLVAAHFIHPIGEDECVFHVDLDGANNHVSNLRIVPISDRSRLTMEVLCDYEFVPREQMTREVAHKYLEYREGRLFWKLRPHVAIRVGDEAGWANGAVWDIHLCGNTYTRNRLVYLMHHGVLNDYILPRNGDQSDSRIENLYAATASQWATISERLGNTRPSP